MTIDNRRNSIIALASIIVVVVLVWVAASKLDRGASNNNQGGVEANQSTSQQQSPQAQEPNKSITREDLTAPVKVPEKGDNTTGDIAVPSDVVPVRPGSESQRRVFNISVSAQAFSPAEIIVKKGDTITINVTAVDGNRDLTQPDFGFSLNIPKGETKLLQMDATTPGKFIFYCKSCGGPESGPIGSIIISP